MRRLDHFLLLLCNLLTYQSLNVVVSLTANVVQVRTSTLTSWQSSEDVIGWCREERTDESYRVFLGTATVDDENRKNEDAATVVGLPFLPECESLGATLWPSGIAMAILLHSNPAFTVDSIDSDDKSRIVELGVGLGLPGRLLAQQNDELEVLSTDNDEAVLSAPGAPTLSNLKTKVLEWRDVEPGSKQPDPYQWILGSDVAYYYFLLRPLMDTIQSYSSAHTRSLLVGQANRESQWELYHNIRDGCYNIHTDARVPPWEGSTRMLLYKLHQQDWQDDVTTEESSVVDGGTVPIAALIHEPNKNGGESTALTSHDYVASAKDESQLEMSF